MGRASASTLVLCYCQQCNGTAVTRSEQILHDEEEQSQQVIAVEASFDRLKLEASASVTPDSTFARLFDLHTSTKARIALLKGELEYWGGNRVSSQITQFLTISASHSYFQEEYDHFSSLNLHLHSLDRRQSDCALLIDACLEEVGEVLRLLDRVLEVLQQSISWSVARHGTYNTDHHFNSSLSLAHPVLIVVYFMAAAMHLLAACSRSVSNFCLQTVKLALRLSTTDPGLGKLIESIPADIRTAQKALPLDTNLTVYAACPTCHTLYPPADQDGVEIYPPRCTSIRFSSGIPCHTRLCKLGVKKGHSVRVPLRPYAMQSFTAFLGAFYSRPGIEMAIRSTNRRIQDGEAILDINQSPGLREFRDATGGIFIDSAEEIRTVWSLSYDGFNPFHNKAAGKSASAGILAMLCLSLPPELCYKPENIFLVGLIPGPKQPAADLLNPYLSLLITTLNACYLEGTWFTRTYEHPTGRRSREAIIPTINDLPGSRKISGCASHSARRFCSLCHLLKADINNIDHATEAWQPVTLGEHRAAAEAWRSASSKSEHAKLYKTNGVRWSELLRLVYWDLTKYVVIDGMHTLFLGLVKHHFRAIVGTHWEESSEDLDFQYDAPTEKALQRGRQVFMKEPTMSRLHKLSIPVLRSLCEEHGVIQQVCTPKPKKRHYISALLTSTIIHSPPTPTLNAHAISDDFNEIGAIETFPFQPILGANKLHQIHLDIKSSSRPTWKTQPPANFGTPTHGKLKADEWRACIEFDLPVLLLKLLSHRNSCNGDLPLAVRSTILLSIAIQFATSNSITSEHIANYNHFIRAYILSIRQLRPDIDLNPIHHNALHLDQFLQRFGPIHGWWMFPIERLIGTLQKLNINYKSGELEKTMLKSFCKTSHLRIVLQYLQAKDPKLIGQAFDIFEQCFPSNSLGTLTTGDTTLSHLTQTVGQGRVAPLDDVVLTQLQVLWPIPGQTAMHFARCIVNGKDFSMSSATQVNSHIFHYCEFRKKWIPATIRSIFVPAGLESAGYFYIAIHNHRAEVPLPLLAEYHQFGASIWSEELEMNPIILRSSDARICGAFTQPWRANTLIMKPILEGANLHLWSY